MERNIVIGKMRQVVVRRSPFVARCEIESGNPRTMNGKQRTTNNEQKGFSLLELMISMFILIILLSVALPTYQRAVQNARETVLKENLFQMRRAIDQYAADKGKLPQSIDDLVTDEYLREKPVDPISETTEWTSIMGDDTSSSEGEQGLKDVKSTADGEDSDGKSYKDY